MHVDRIGAQHLEEGAHRTAEIVKGLRNFSRLDEEAKKLASVNQGLEATLLVLKHQLKNRIERLDTLLNDLLTYSRLGTQARPFANMNS